MMATLMNSAPAKVVPMAFKNLFFLKVDIRRGSRPTIITIAMKRTMNTHFRMASTVLCSIYALVLLLMQRDLLSEDCKLLIGGWLYWLF